MRRKRKSDLETSSKVLQSLLQDGKSELGYQFKRWRIWYKWPEVIGPTIAEHCEPVWFSKGVLYIWVKSSSWMQHLVFLQEDIRNKVNTSGGAAWVKKIRFTLDRHSVPSMDEKDKREKYSILSK